MTSEVTEFYIGCSPQCPLEPKAEIVHEGEELLKIPVVMSAARQIDGQSLSFYIDDERIKFHEAELTFIETWHGGERLVKLLLATKVVHTVQGRLRMLFFSFEMSCRSSLSTLY